MTQQVEQAEIHATRRGYALHKWVNDKQPGGTEVVLTDATLVYNIPEGYQVLITSLNFDMLTVSDDVHVNLVACKGIDGTGCAVDISGHCHMFTGTVVDGAASKERPFHPPLHIMHSDGFRSISIKVHASDGAATISVGWHGWVEREL